MYQLHHSHCFHASHVVVLLWLVLVGLHSEELASHHRPSSQQAQSFCYGFNIDIGHRQNRQHRPQQHHDRKNSISLFATPGNMIDKNSQLAQLASQTVLSIDSGDLNVIRDYVGSGYITDATTNPLFVSQAAFKGDKVYAAMVDDAIQYAVKHCPPKTGDDDALAATTGLAIDRLAVNLGKAISDIVPGYVSTEVDPRLSFDTEASVERAKRIMNMYENELGVPRNRVLIKLAATWEGILAAEQLEKEGIQCNLTLIFSVIQAIACAQYGAHLISPFPGRVLDWYKVKLGRTDGVADPEDDEGVIACKEMYHYFKAYGHPTICMPASWRPSRAGPGHDLDEIQALAGVDRMTIPAPLLEQLASNMEPLEQKLVDPTTAGEPTSTTPPLVGNGTISEKEFRLRFNNDGCGTDKLAEGIRAFIGETDKLESLLKEKIQATLS